MPFYVNNKQFYSSITQMIVASLGSLAGFLINVCYVIFFDVIPVSEVYLLSIENYSIRVLAFHLAVVYQIILAAILVLPLFCVGVGIILPTNPSFLARIFTLGVALLILANQTYVIKPSDLGLYIIGFSVQFLLLFLVGYILIKFGNYIRTLYVLWTTKGSVDH